MLNRLRDAVVMWQAVLQADQFGISRGLTAASSTQIAAAGLRLRGHESGWGPTSTEVSTSSVQTEQTRQQGTSPCIQILWLDAREPSLVSPFLVLCCRLPSWQSRNYGALALVGSFSPNPLHTDIFLRLLLLLFLLPCVPHKSLIAQYRASAYARRVAWFTSK